MSDMMKYSIIMPTYNSMRWIQSSVNSVLSQTFEDFELIVVDSGSTDGTVEWLSQLNDNRVRIHKSRNRINIVENWSRFSTLPKGRYMTIMGHDDILYPTYLETIDKLIATYPEAGLFQTHFNFIDGKGDMIRKCATMKPRYNPTELVEHILQHKIEITATGFMMPSEKYDSIGGIPDYPNLLYADSELWIKMILDSYLVVSSESCFDFRFHIENTSKSAGNIRLVAFERMVDFLNRLKSENEEFRQIIERNAEAFLKNYAIGSCHKLIYVPKQSRGGVTMDKIIASAKRSAQKLLPTVQFDPHKFYQISIAKTIDSNTLLRKLFLFFKSLEKRTF